MAMPAAAPTSDGTIAMAVTFGRAWAAAAPTRPNAAMPATPMALRRMASAPMTAAKTATNTSVPAMRAGLSFVPKRRTANVLTHEGTWSMTHSPTAMTGEMAPRKRPETSSATPRAAAAASKPAAEPLRRVGAGRAGAVSVTMFTVMFRSRTPLRMRSAARQESRLESSDPVIQTRAQHRMARVEHELSGLSDHALVLAVGRYDEAAMAELYRRHGRSVFGLATRLLTDRTIAEEILQDVFVRLWRQPERFDANRGELRAFLLRETHSRSVDRMRSDSARSRREDRHQREDASPTVDVDREVWHLIRSERIKDALDELSSGEREAIMLAYFEGHTYREVAVMLDEPEGTIKSRIRLGLKKLADKLEAAGLGAPS